MSSNTGSIATSAGLPAVRDLACWCTPKPTALFLAFEAGRRESESDRAPKRKASITEDRGL